MLILVEMVFGYRLKQLFHVELKTRRLVSIATLCKGCKSPKGNLFNRSEIRQILKSILDGQCFRICTIRKVSTEETYDNIINNLIGLIFINSVPINSVNEPVMALPRKK